MTRIMGIDPGIANIGWGVITSTGKYQGSGHITTPSFWDIEDRVYIIGLKLKKQLIIHKPEIIVIEMFVANRGLSRRRAAGKISMVYGMIVYLARAHKAQTVLASPNHWMRRFLGLTRTEQFSKLDLRRAVNKTLGTKVSIEHEAEALGMALSILRRR